MKEPTAPPPASMATPALIAEVTVTVALPVTEPLVALMVTVGVPLPGAVYRPVPLIVPGVLLVLASDQEMAAVMALPNWSLAAAVNCRVALLATVALAGETTMAVSV